MSKKAKRISQNNKKSVANKVEVAKVDAALIEHRAKIKGLIADKKFASAIEEIAEKKQYYVDAEVMYYTAYCYTAIGDVERAINWVDHAISYAPNSIKARILLSRICIMTKRNIDALNILEHVLKNGALVLDEIIDIRELLYDFKENDPQMLLDNYPSIAKFLDIDEFSTEIQSDHIRYVKL